MIRIETGWVNGDPARLQRRAGTVVDVKERLYRSPLVLLEPGEVEAQAILHTGTRSNF